MPTFMRARTGYSLGATLAPLLCLTIACGEADVRAESAALPGDAQPRRAVQTQPFDTDPCTWVTLPEIEAFIGSIQGTPWRGKSAENPSRQDGGRACVYQVGGDDANPEVIAAQVDFEDATSYEVGYDLAIEAVSQHTTEDLRAHEPPTQPGWDHTGGIGQQWVGRLGHMAVVIGRFGAQVPDTNLYRLAALIRDRVPDLPVAAEYGDPNGAGYGPDPCALVTREEAEAVLGKLPIPPYRSKSSTPFADGSGEACTYYRGQHRVLVITPHWSDAEWLFGAGAGLTDEVTIRTGVGEESADTLEGPWEQSKADLGGGTLNFLTGDRMIEMQYRTAGVELGEALKLARTAVERLAAAP